MFDLSKPKQGPVVLIRVATSDELLEYENRDIVDTLSNKTTMMNSQKESIVEDSFFIKCDIDDILKDIK